MGINLKLLDEVGKTPSRILAVTKYFDTKLTKEYISSLSEYKELIYGYGENRLERIQEKTIDREKCHFIGNIQSRKISDIIENCSVIHSVANEKHFLLCQKHAEDKQLYLKIFLQLNLDRNKDIGFSKEDIKALLLKYKRSDFCEIIGISGMGAGVFTENEKISEFQRLIEVRDAYFHGGLISGGTSRDYKIAVDMNIDIVRIGQALFQ